MRETETLVMRGIAPWEFEEYFSSIGGNLTKSGSYVGEDWEVALIKGYGSLGSIRIHETEITFHADAAILKSMVHKFRLKFMRAGG